MPSDNVRTAVDLFLARVEATPTRPAIRVKEDGVWKMRTWAEWDVASREIAGGLRSLGISTGDRVNILANTRPEWVETDVGILLAGGVTVPIYQSNTPRECEYIINDCKGKVVVVEDKAQLDKLMHPEIRPTLTGVSKVVLFSGEPPAEAGDWVTTIGKLRADGRAWLAKNKLDLGAVKPEDIFTIVYTSGTTGPPKGVVLTHENVVFECNAIARALDITVDDEQVLFLPLAHIFAKLLEWASIAFGMPIAFAESIPKLIENMKEIRPTVVGAVPRVYEKAYAKIQGSLSEKQKGKTGFIVNFALAAGKKRSEAQQAGKQLAGFDALSVKLADKIVFSKIRDTFGGRLRFFVSGGAPLAREIAEFFHSCGILILEGYGLTETTAATNLNRPDAYRFGTVGYALPGVEIKIAEDGEVLMRGKNILREYYGKEEATREAIDADGWFHSGDIGVIEDGYLRITDRKKDIIVTAGGKNVAPQNIEGTLKAQCPYISQVVVHGDKRQFLTALITVNEETTKAWAEAQGLPYRTQAELAGAKEVLALIDDAVKKLNGGLASYETIKKYKVLPNDFTQDAGEMTPTLKVKRKFVSEKYKSTLDAFYAGDRQ